MCFKTEIPYYFNETNLPLTIGEEKIIHSNSEVKIMLILSVACMEMFATRIT